MTATGRFSRLGRKWEPILADLGRLLQYHPSVAQILLTGQASGDLQPHGTEPSIGPTESPPMPPAERNIPHCNIHLTPSRCAHGIEGLPAYIVWTHPFEMDTARTALHSSGFSTLQKGQAINILPVLIRSKICCALPGAHPCAK